MVAASTNLLASKPLSKWMAGCLAGAGNVEGNLDNLGLSLDFNARASHGVQTQHAEISGHSSLWPSCPQLLATSNALPGAVTSGVAHFLGMA